MIGTVAVGVGGAAGWPALAWAVGEAVTTGARLAVHRVCRPGSPLSALGADRSLARLELVEPALSRAVAAARVQLGGHRVGFSLHTGETGAELVHAAGDADLMVIGASGESRRCVQDTVRRVTEHASCPVVVVRPVDHEGNGPFGGHVVVGVDGDAGGHSALGFAFGYADRHRLPLAAVHVSEQRRDDFWSDASTLSTQPAHLGLLAAEVGLWQRKFPDVRVESAVLAGPVADGLLGAGAGARLLVVGNRRRGPLGRVLTGNVTRSVIDRARCPVAVAHVDDARPGRSDDARPVGCTPRRYGWA